MSPTGLNVMGATPEDKPNSPGQENATSSMIDCGLNKSVTVTVFDPLARPT
jgi:hypothetical protein